MPVKVDLSGLRQMLKEAENMMRAEVPAIMKSVVDLGAAYARDNHEYVDRTGRLTKGTRGIWVRQTRNSVVRNLDLKMPYASYVRARGLMDVDHAAAEIEEELRERFDELRVE